MGGNNTKPETQPNDSKYHHSSLLSVKTKKGENKTTVNPTALVSAEFDEVMPEIWKGSHYDVKRIIWDYAFDPRWFEKPFSFFRSSLEQEILALAYYAAPLDKVERYIRTAHAKNEKHLFATLVKAIIEAIKNLDVTIRDEKGEEIAEGMAEKLMKLLEELFPNTSHHCLEMIRLAVPSEDEEVKKAREAANVAAVHQLFDAIKKNDKNTDAAIKNFEEFVKHTSQLNRLHLLFVAFDVLANRGGELDGKWYGALADRICFEAIGIAIEMGFSPRMRKILEIGVFYILNRTKTAERQLDIDGKTFVGRPGSNQELGVNSYYDVYGVSCSALRLRRGVRSSLGAALGGVSKLITSNYISVANLCSDRTFNRRARR